MKTAMSLSCYTNLENFPFFPASAFFIDLYIRSQTTQSAAFEKLSIVSKQKCNTINVLPKYLIFASKRLELTF